MVYMLAALIFAALGIYLGSLVCTIVILCHQVKKEEFGHHGEWRYRG